MILRRLLSAALALCLFGSVPARGIDGVAFEIGRGGDVGMWRAGAQCDWNKRWFQSGNWHLGGYWDVALGYWHRDDVRTGERDEIFEVGLTPVFRIQPNALVGPYVEAAIGFHLLSHTSIGDRRLSTAFQFGDHLGLGYRFGVTGRYDLGYRFQHLSNAGMKQPNSGINFHQIRLQYRF